MMGKILELGEYRTLTATTAETGIQMARKHKPDLILMDIHLPKMDGLSATREIKNDEELKEIPVIALTAFAMEEDKAKTLEAGCDHHLTKPFKIQDLLQIIEKFLNPKGKNSS